MSQPRRRRIKKYTYRGKNIDELCAMNDEELWELFPARMRRHLYHSNGMRGKYLKLMERVKASKKNVKPGEKPKSVKTHLRNCIVMP